AGRQFALAHHRVVSIGRDEGCTWQIVDPLISRQHLQIRQGDDGRHFAADYRSANGVVINGKQIVDDVMLADGDMIRIGGTTMRYSAASDDAPAQEKNAANRQGEWKRSTLLRP